jgi:hypothetical protein
MEGSTPMTVSPLARKPAPSEVLIDPLAVDLLSGTGVHLLGTY